MIIMKKVTFRWLLHCGRTGTILQNLKKTIDFFLGCPPMPSTCFLGGPKLNDFDKNQLNFEVTFTRHFEPLYSPTWLQLSPNLASKNLSQTGLKTMLKFNIPKSCFLQPLLYEMQVFASPRGSQNEQKRIPRPLFIRAPFQLKKNSLQASILLQLGSLLGLPRRPQEASKAS